MCLEVLLRAWFCQKLNQSASSVQNRLKLEYVCSSAGGSWNTAALRLFAGASVNESSTTALFTSVCFPLPAGTVTVEQQDTEMRVLYPYHLCYSSDWKFCCAAEHYKHAVTVLCHTTNVKGPGCIFHSMAADTALGEDHCSCPSWPCAVLSTALLEGSEGNLHTFLAYLSFFFLSAP